jgi:hypothetical protein
MLLGSRDIQPTKYKKNALFTMLARVLLTVADSSIWAEFFWGTTWALDQLTVKVSSETDASLLEYKFGQKSTIGAHFSLGLSVKMRYLGKARIFFQSACVDIHKTVASTTYIKISSIGVHRLSSFPQVRSWLTRNGCYSKKSFINPLPPNVHWGGHW